jgi:hypothetical protein
MRDKTVRLDLVLKTVHDCWKAELDANRENELAILRHNSRICKALEALPTSVCVDSFRVCVDDEKGEKHDDTIT